MGLERFTYEGQAMARIIALGSAVTIGQDTYQSDLTRTYVQLTLLNSFPVVNLNGDTLLPPVLAKAVPTAENQPLNLEHQMADNGEIYQGTDLVVGTMIKAYYAAKGEVQLLPETSSPVKVIAVLWNRVDEAQKIIASIGDGEKQYGISFEILFGATGWVVFGKDGPSYENEINETLMAAWKAKKFDQVARAVGGDGSENSTHLWGGGFTLVPADEKAGIESILTGSFRGHRVLAAKTNKPKESVMNPKQKILAAMKAALAKINTVLAQSGFTVQVTGGDKLSLNLAGNEISQPEDFYLYGMRRSDGTYQVSASLHILQGGIDGFKEDTRLEWTGGDKAIMTEVEPATATVKTPPMLQSEIDAHVETIAGFAGYLSPAEVQAKVEAAVAAAKIDAKPSNSDDDRLTPGQVDDKISEAMAARDAIETAMKTRSEKIVADGFPLTEERKISLTAFTADEAGDQAFSAWLKALKTEQVAMVKNLEGKGVDVTDPIRKAVACLNSQADSGYAALVASHGVPEETFSPSLGALGDGLPDEDGAFPRVM